jgi:hypothetical protein
MEDSPSTPPRSKRPIDSSPPTSPKHFKRQTMRTMIRRIFDELRLYLYILTLLSEEGIECMESSLFIELHNNIAHTKYRVFDNVVAMCREYKDGDHSYQEDIDEVLDLINEAVVKVLTDSISPIAGIALRNVIHSLPSRSQPSAIFMKHV